MPDVERLYRQVARTLRPGGYYRVEHLNSTQVQLDEELPWDGTAYRVAQPQDTGTPIRLPWCTGTGGATKQVPLDYFAHSLDQLIGGLGRAGFDILQFTERSHGDPADGPGSFGHQCAYPPPIRVACQAAGEAAEAMDLTASDVICATPRTGSYLLCDALAATGVAGYPTEHLSATYQQHWQQRWDAPEYADHISRVLTEGSTGNGSSVRSCTATNSTTYCVRSLASPRCRPSGPAR